MSKNKLRLPLIGFQNYRIFKNKTLIDLKPITILTGPNSSGKSSVFKAIKLLKQNCPKNTNGGLPVKLDFILDDHGHYLGSYQRILSRGNGEKENLSFIIPFELETLGDNYFAELVYEPYNHSGDKSVRISNFSVFKIKGKEHIKLFSLFAGLEGFERMTVDFLHFKSCLEKCFLPFFKEPDVPIFHTKHIEYKKKLRELPGQDLLAFFKDQIPLYDKSKPVLHYHKVLDKTVNLHNEWGMAPEDWKDYYNGLEQARKYYAPILQKISTEEGISEEEAIDRYFIQIEEKLFKFLKTHSVEHWIEFSSHDRNMSWWENLIVTTARSEEDYRKFSTGDKLKEFDLNYRGMMYDIEATFAHDIRKHPNTFVFFNYIRYIIMESIEQVRTSLDSINFFDPNRIEQTIFYHHSNARVAYKLINDYLNQVNDETNNQFIISQLRKLNIADSFEIISTGYGIYDVQLTSFHNEKIPLAEYGFGITKLFFLLIALRTYSTLLIEEPESNLHPDFQSRLAEIFADSIVTGQQLVIESHSEYFIRKLQYLIATNKVSKDDVVIKYFNPPGEREKSGLIRQIGFKSDGSLDGEFGSGFFDEIANIIEDIYKHTFYN